MNEDQINTIKKELAWHVQQISVFKWRYKHANSNVDTLLNYFEISEASKKFFNIDQVEELQNLYLQEVTDIANIFGSSNFSSKEKVLNFLEYIRANVLYDNINSRAFLFSDYSARISQSGASAALLGKGVCSSQAKFLRDLLIMSGEDAYAKDVSFLRDGPVTGQHTVTFAKLSDVDSKILLDPTWYNGTLDSVSKSFVSPSLEIYDREELGTLDITLDDIFKARDFVSDFLIEKYGIKQASEELKIQDADSLEKQIRMLVFMEKHLVNPSTLLTYRNMALGERELSQNVALELFYKANNIPFKLDCSGEKSLTTYTTNIDGKMTSIAPLLSFSQDSMDENRLTDKFHYIKDSNGEEQYLWALDEQYKARYEQAIDNARQIRDYSAKDIDSVTKKEESVIDSIVETKTEIETEIETRTETVEEEAEVETEKKRRTKTRTIDFDSFER